MISQNVRKGLFIIVFFIEILLVSVPAFSFAQINGSTGSLNGSSGTLNGSSGGAQSTTLINPIHFSSICGLVQAIFNILLELGTPVAVLFLVYAGFKFIVARGNSEALSKARDNIVHVILGIAIFLGAWILGQVIASTINSLATAAGQPPITGNTCN
jgi:Type IV secretion system pilin